MKKQEQSELTFWQTRRAKHKPRQGVVEALVSSALDHEIQKHDTT